MLSTLPLYTFSHNKELIKAFYQSLSDYMRAAGVKDFPCDVQVIADDLNIYQNRDLLFGQCCGFPLTTCLADHLEYLATPHYELEGCRGAYYSSFAVVLNDDKKSQFLPDYLTARWVANEPHSHSGYNVLVDLWACHGLTRSEGAVSFSGSHEKSVEALLNKDADIAFIDAISWYWLCEADKDLRSRLSVIGQSKYAPAPAFVMSKKRVGDYKEQIQNLLVEAFADNKIKQHAAALKISGISVLSEQVYIEDIKKLCG